MSLRSTSHAVQRMSQRGFKPAHLDLISLIATEVPDGLLARKDDVREVIDDAREVIRVLRHFIKDVERIADKRVVQMGGAVVTAYHADRRTQRRLLSDKPNKLRRKGGWR